MYEISPRNGIPSCHVPPCILQLIIISHNLIMEPCIAYTDTKNRHQSIEDESVLSFTIRFTFRRMWQVGIERYFEVPLHWWKVCHHQQRGRGWREQGQSSRVCPNLFGWPYTLGMTRRPYHHGPKLPSNIILQKSKWKSSHFLNFNRADKNVI